MNFLKNPNPWSIKINNTKGSLFMNKMLWFITLGLITTNVMANCDLSNYHWDCTLNMHPKPSKYVQSLVYCGDVYGYLSQTQYDILVKYYRANVNMSLTLNGNRIDGPCIPYGR